MNQVTKMIAAESTLTILMKQLIKHHYKLQPMFGNLVLEQCPTQTHVEEKKLFLKAKFRGQLSPLPLLLPLP